MVGGIIEGNWLLFCLGNIISDTGIAFLALSILLNETVLQKRKGEIWLERIFIISVIVIISGVFLQVVALILSCNS